MGIISITTDVAGQIGDLPRRVKLITTDSLATITTAGYLNNQNLQGYQILPSDVLDVEYLWNTSTNVGTYEVFLPSFSNGVITLSIWANAGDVLLPVVSGDFANFNGTTGQIKDAGYSPTNAAKTKVVMLNAAPTINHVAQFTAADGTIGDGGVLGTAAAKAASDNTKATVASVNGATVANHIATYTDTAGTIGEDAATAINLGNIQAGSDTTKGQLLAYGGATNGHIVINPIGNTGNTAITIQNAVYGQATVLTFNDPGAATGGLVVSDAPFVMKSVAQAVVAGGAAAQTVTDAFCTAGSMVTASWNDTTNAVSIQKVAAGNGSFVVTSSADPGASHLNYIITK